MAKYTVTIDAPKNFKTLEFEDYNKAARMAVIYKEYAFNRGLHWTISFFTGKNLDAQITT